MNRRVVAFLGLLSMVLVLLVPAVVSAQTVTPPAATPTVAPPTPTPTRPATTTVKSASLADVRAKFAGWTQLDAVANGYVRDQFCISTAAGGMGYHAVKASLVDAAVDALEPEILLLDGSGNVVGAEYQTRGPNPTTKVFPEQSAAQTFTASPTAGILALHTWFIANPSGTFAPFNPNVTCPAGSAPPAAPTATATPRPPVTGGLTLPGGWGLYLAIVGAGVVAVGFAIARRTASKS